MSPCAVENTENSSPYQGTNNKKSKASSPAPASVQRRRRRRATIECNTSPKLDYDASSSGGLWKERIDEILNRDSSSTSRQGHEHQNQRSPSISISNTNANTSALNNLDSLCPFKALQSQKMVASTASTAHQVCQPKKTISRRPKFVAPTMLSDESHTTSSGGGASCCSSSSGASSAQKKKISKGFKAQQRRRHSMSECPTNNNEMFTQSMPQLPLDDDNTTNDTTKMSDAQPPPSNKKCISKFKYQRRNSDHGPRTHNTLFSGSSSPASSPYVKKKQQQQPSFVTGSCTFNSNISTSSSSSGKSSQFAKSKSKKEQVLPSLNKNFAASNISKASEAHIFAQWDAALERYQREQQETSNGNNKSVARGVQDGLKEPEATQAMTEKSLSSSIVSGSRRRRSMIIPSNNDDDDEDCKPRLHRTCSAGSFANLASAISSRNPSSTSSLATTTSAAAAAANKKSTLSKKKVTTTISSTVTATTCSSASDSHASTAAANSSVAATSVTSNLEMLGHTSNNSSRVHQQPHKGNFVIQVPSQSSVEGLDDSLSSLEVSLRSYTTSNSNVLDVSSSSITKQAGINEINERNAKTHTISLYNLKY